MQNKLKFSLKMLPILAILGCNRETAKPDAGTELKVSKLSAKRNEPVVAEISGAATGTKYNWSVTSGSNASITFSNNKASVMFPKAGRFTIKAELFQGTSVTSYSTLLKEVSVTDTIYNPGGPGSGTQATVVPFSANEIITVKPLFQDSGLVLLNKTNNQYNCLNNTLQTTVVRSSSLTIDFTGVLVPGSANCATGQNTSQNFIFAGVFANGNYPLIIKAGGVTYNGSITLSNNGNTATFTWPYSSGVVISPLTVTK